MSGELSMRVVREDNVRRVSVYRRSDGTYEYIEEMISEWDESPPSWVGQRQSGIFQTAKAAMAEAKQTINWMRHPLNPDDCATNVDKQLRKWRAIGVAEHALLMHLLREEFQGRTEIVEQVKSLEVMRAGRWSLMLRSRGPFANVKDGDTKSRRPNDRIPVEAFYDDVIDESKWLVRFGSIVRIALHVTDGELNELEIYKENGRPILIDPYEVDLSRVHFY